MRRRSGPGRDRGAATELGAPADLRFDALQREVYLDAVYRKRPIRCRITEAALRDWFDAGEGEAACIEAARAHFEEICFAWHYKLAAGTHEADGSVLLR